LVIIFAQLISEQYPLKQGLKQFIEVQQLNFVTSILEQHPCYHLLFQAANYLITVYILIYSVCSQYSSDGTFFPLETER